MQHSSIVKSLARVALAQGDQTVRHQVERLAEALRKGEDQDAAAFQRLLDSASKSKTLAPSRLNKSVAGTGTEDMTPGTRVPVDRESSAPLATVIFPDENRASFPILPDAAAGTINDLILEWTHRDLILDAGMNPSLTSLMYGPPGTGKTTLALWLAKRMGLPAVVARLDGLISSLLGTTARNIGALFAFANRYNCVLILDEFDAIAKLRDDPNEVGEIKRVVNTLLQNIDTRENIGITIGLTNHESLLDPAVWRRFRVQLAVPLPTAKERLEIAETSLGRDSSSTKTDAKLLAWVSHGFSGAELLILTEKYRKRRLINTDNSSESAALVAQLAASTSLNIDRSRVAVLSGDGGRSAATLAESQDPRFSQSELAALFGVSTKTISRRMSEYTSGVRHDA